MLFLSLIGCKKECKKNTTVASIAERAIPDTSMVNEDVELSVKALTYCYDDDLYVELNDKEQFSYTLKAYASSICCNGECVCPTAIKYKDTLIHFQPAQKGTYLFYITERKDIIKVDTMIVIDIRDNQRKKSILGEWDWIMTWYFGWESKIVTTPESTGDSKLLNIENDSIKYYSDGILDLCFSYGFKYLPITSTFHEPGDYPDSTLSLVINNDETRYFLTTNDTLILWSTNRIGPYDYFKRR